MRESIFSVDAIRREQEQAQIQKMVGIKPEIKNDRKVPMNITLPAEYKIKLQNYAKKKHLSASIVIQLWIEKYLNE